MEKSAQDRSPKGKVLIVDDDAMTVKLCTMALKRDETWMETMPAAVWDVAA